MEMSPDRSLRQRVDVAFVSKVFLVLVTIEVALLLAMSISSAIEADSLSLARYAFIAIPSTLFLVYFAFDAVDKENMFQLWAFTLSSMLATVFVIFHYMHPGSLNSDHWEKFSLSVLIVTSTFQGIYFVLCYFVQQSFGWRAYKRVGGDPELQAAYQTLQIFLSLLKTDVQIAVMLVMLGGFFLLEGWELALNIVALGISILWAFWGYYCAKRESRHVMLAWIAFALVEPAYIVQKIMQIEDDHFNRDKVSPLQFLITGCIALVVRVALVVLGVLVMRNFKKGLRERAFSHVTQAPALRASLI
eukprot:GFYU01000549.1.p1 GENE.GFYU01000549.1~~GFYU01000549.1.p1  ORF type:complete len:318 (+),score=65.70 GFYU01000549.1:48-956(+)